jgi:hypothetical protein
MSYNGMYLRIETITNIEIPAGLTYDEAIAYAHQQNCEGNLEPDLYIDVCYEDGAVANEAGFNEVKGD